MLDQWQNALAQKNIHLIKEILKKGYIPENLNELIVVKDFNSEKTISLIEILLHDMHLGQDAIYFSIADNLLQKGAKLPEALKKEEDFSSISDYLQFLSHNDRALYIALRNDPTVINRKGEMGETVLHHAATIGRRMGSNSASLILELLFNSDLADFTCQDANGNTPLHIAAQSSDDRVTCRFVFPNYVLAAIKKNADLNKLNNQGQAIIHIAVRHSYTCWPTGRDNNIEKLLSIAKDHINVNTMSSSGSTAFYYAVNWLHLAEAISLLDAGADSALYGLPDRDPMKMINEHISNFTLNVGLINAFTTGSLNDFVDNNKEFIIEMYKTEMPSEDEPTSTLLYEFAQTLANTYQEKHDIIKSSLETLQTLKQRMVSIAFSNRQDKLSFWSNSEPKEEDDVTIKTYNNPSELGSNQLK